MCPSKIIQLKTEYIESVSYLDPGKKTVSNIAADVWMGLCICIYLYFVFAELYLELVIAIEFIERIKQISFWVMQIIVFEKFTIWQIILDIPVLYDIYWVNTAYTYF